MKTTTPFLTLLAFMVLAMTVSCRSSQHREDDDRMNRGNSEEHRKDYKNDDRKDHGDRKENRDKKGKQDR